MFLYYVSYKGKQRGSLWVTINTPFKTRTEAWEYSKVFLGRAKLDVKITERKRRKGKGTS